MKKKILTSAIAFFALSLGAWAQIPLSEELVVVSNERGVNSEELEFSPVFYKDGIVFISSRHESLIYNVKDKNIGGKNIMSIYRSRRNKEGFLSEPAPFANELIFRSHEGPVTFDHTGSTIFFTRNELKEEAPDGFKKLQIYTSMKDSLEWGSVVKLPFNNLNFNYCHPSISADQDVLFISSDVPGGYGGMDIYAVYKVDGQWSQMVNLGESVNTPGNEVFPYIGADQTLYFASDGHGGLGGLDLFYATEKNEEWSAPINLGRPFNSPSDDFGFIVDRDNKNGYFSSDRAGGFGDDDIYKFYVESQYDSPLAAETAAKSLEGLVVTDADGNPIEGAQVSAIDFRDIPLSEQDGQVVKLRPGATDGSFVLDVDTEGLGKAAMTSADGTADMPLGRGNYVLKITKDGHVPQYVVVSPETDLSNLPVTLQKAVDCVKLTGKAVMQGLNSPVSGALVKVVDVETEETVTVYSDGSGNYEYCIDCDRIYSVYAEKDQMRSAPSIVNTKEMPCDATSNEIDLPIYLEGSPIYAGMTIRLPNIYFNFNDAALRPDAYPDLDGVVGMLNQTPGLKLELASHTDARGGTAYNRNLSQRRSQSVMDYLVDKGVEGYRLHPIGYGESQIRNRCTNGTDCSEEEHQYNRRTEIKILELGDGTESRPIANVSTDVQTDSYVSTESFDDANSDKGGRESNTIGVADEEEKTTSTKVAKPVVKKRTTESSDSEYSTNNRDYVVVAGTFANHDNALRRVSLLLEKGFLDSSIVKQGSGLYAVYVQTYDIRKEAYSAVKDLDNNQIHSYVMRR